MLRDVAKIPALASALAEQNEVISEFYGIGNRILAGLVPLSRPQASPCLLEHNFFSSLFLATFAALGMDRPKRLLYGLVNQCLRAWVTGCDNILDGDDRAIFPIDLPGDGYRFKAVLTVMTADRVLAERLLAAVESGDMTAEQAARLQRVSLACLVPSGMEEHSEEAGVHEALPPDAILHEIHAVKTGRLFEAPLVVPQSVGDLVGPKIDLARQGLHTFGLGCQIIDDMADHRRDLLQARHNYVVSLWVHGKGGRRLEALREAQQRGEDLAPWIASAWEQASIDARRHMDAGLHFLAEAGLPFGGAERADIARAMLPLLLEKDPEEIQASAGLASAS